MWEQAYRNFGTSFERLVEVFYDHLERNHYDKVILTRFEDHRIHEPEYELIHLFIDQVVSYAYGWEEQDLLDNPDRFCEGGSHSQAVLLEDWMKIKGQVFISGAFDGECIEDLEIALRHLEVKFERIE
jgi:hypothetical protein